MSEYKQYRRKQIAELADWEPGFDMSGVSVSDADRLCGSPKLGDKIARNPANHGDRWLIAKAYFEANFAEEQLVKKPELDAIRYAVTDLLEGEKQSHIESYIARIQDDWETMRHEAEALAAAGKEGKR